MMGKPVPRGSSQKGNTVSAQAVLLFLTVGDRLRVRAQRLTGRLGSVYPSVLPPAGPPSPQDCFILGNASPSSRAAFARCSHLEFGSPGDRPRRPRVSVGTARALPLPGLQVAPQGEWWPFPTGLCCCLAPSSGREGEGAAGGRQAGAHHRGSGECPSALGAHWGPSLLPHPHAVLPPTSFVCLSTSVFPFHLSFPTPLPPFLPFSRFLPLCLGTGPLQS